MKLLVFLAIFASVTHGKEDNIAVVSDARSRHNSTSSSRVIRNTRGYERTEACDMLIAIDEPLYVTYDKDLKQLTNMVQLYVKQLNEIYHSTVLMDKYNDLYFRLAEIRILYDFCTECNHTQQVFLEEFTKMDTSRFCLAHIFTYRDFPAGIQGLAYKGTVCSSSHNTGFTTFLNHQVESSASDSVMTFAHEVGHNMGAEHDEDVNCGSGYIMSSSGSTKLSHTDQEFSQCSIEAIHKCIDDVKSRRYKNCFKHKIQKTNDEDFSICGDYKVEGDEECDCGMSYQSCSDPCCYAAHISPKDLAWNASAVPCRTHKSPNCLHPFRSAFIFGFLTPWIFIGSSILALIIGLCYDWRHNKKCFKHVTEHHKTSFQRISKSEPRSPEPSPRPLSPPVPPARVQKAKAPAPAPPLVAPYLPPMRSQSQPPPPSFEKLNSFEMSPRSSIQRPTEPPPPIPLISPVSPVANAKSPPPPVPYNTRPNISEVAYLKKKFEESNQS